MPVNSITSPELNTNSPQSQTIFSASLSGGAGFDSGILDIRALTSLTLVVANGSAVTARPGTLTLYQEDGLTVIAVIPITGAISISESYGFGAAHGGTNVTTNRNWDLPPKIRYQVGAAGADTLSIRCWGR